LSPLLPWLLSELKKLQPQSPPELPKPESPLEFRAATPLRASVRCISLKQMVETATMAMAIHIAKLIGQTPVGE
jgi:hypothetical protein